MTQERKEGLEELESQILREAAGWVVRADLGLSKQDQAELKRWRDKSPAHADAYDRRQSQWRRFDQLGSEQRPPSSDPLRPSRRKPARRLLRIAGWAALAASLAVAFIQLRPNDSSTAADLSGDYVAAGYERHRLEDSSVIELNQGARLTVAFSPGERFVTLHAGEAHFAVAKDPNRPFIVQAKDTRIQALGTAFNVNYDARSVEVVVAEGVVRVDASSPPESGLDSNPTEPIILTAGQRSLIESESSPISRLIEQVSDEELERRDYWRSPNLEFIDQPLAQIVHQLNRYNDAQVQIRDPELAQKKVTLSIRPKNIEGFLKMVEALLDAENDRPSTGVIVLKTRTS